jgi:hypothetical protein
VRPDEAEFAELARRSPTSAGFYLDAEGRLVIVVRDERDEPAAQAAGADLIARKRVHDARLAAGGVVIRRGQYTFDELRQWRDRILDNLVGRIQGITSLDLTEHTNRVTIGLGRARFDELRQSLPLDLLALGVDTSAVVYTVDGLQDLTHGATSAFRSLGRLPPLAASSIAYPATWDALVGGINVLGTSPSGGGCTLGIVAAWGGVNVLITASHCSSQTFQLDNSPLYQPSAARQVGTEFYDPGGWSCYLVYNCRWSDANLYSLTQGIAAHRGLIARPQFSAGPGSTGGSTAVDLARPYFIVQTADDWQLVTGQFIHKVGRTTGWTWGQITQTCKDFFPDPPWENNKAVMCTYEPTMSVMGGDSGGPAFALLGNGYNQLGDLVNLVGIVKGRNNHLAGHPNHRCVFSKWNYVKAELAYGGGQIIATRAPTLPHFSISGSILFTSPLLTWAPVPGATKYNVFKVGPNGEELVGVTPYTSFSDGSNVLEYTGSSPAGGWPHNVQYFVYAVNGTDLSPMSNGVWYRGASGTFSVSINGPSVVGPSNYDCAFWVAQVSGAASIVSYAWTGLFTSDEVSVQGIVPQSGGELQLVVVDSQGRTGGYILQISYDPGNQDLCV